jgi:hypothetical protein
MNVGCTPWQGKGREIESERRLRQKPKEGEKEGRKLRCRTCFFSRYLAILSTRFLDSVTLEV